tara:strand:+ start:3319 stop:5127 length:1809 start_codon:yes stop_codon:yes gene_type:complete
MKFIGQYIQQFIARFKSDVYLDDIDSGTIASGGNLGLDSNNKIVKASVSGGSSGISHDGSTANGVLTFKDADEATVEANFTFDGNDALISSTGKLKLRDTNSYINSPTANNLEIVATDITLDAAGDIALEAAGNDITVDSDTLTITSSTADQPVLKLLNTTDDDQASRLIFEKLRDDDGVASGQNLGEIWFFGQDNAQNTEDYVAIVAEIDVSTGGQESGKLTSFVAAHDGSNQPGLILTGGSVSQEVDVTIGNGAASVTTVAGTLTMGSTATINNSGVIQVAAQTVIDHDQLANYAANEHFTQANITTVGTITTGTWRGTAINVAYLDGQSGTNTGDETTASINALDITEVGTVDSGVWNGTSISTTYTDAKVTSIVAGDGIDVSGATGDVTVTAETATDSNPGVVELATTAEAVTGTDTARAVTPAGLAARVSQIVNIKGYVTLQNDIYDYASPYVTDDEAPFQLDKSYGSGTIDSSTEQAQSSFFRSNGFHVPFACTVSALQVQASVNGSGGGNIVAALVEYRPSTASGDTNDYPRTVYEEVTVASNNNNNKVATTTIDAADLDATVIPAGSHLMLMVKGDSTTSGDLAVVSMSIGLSW